MAYVDGFVIPVAKRKLPAYLRIARRAGRIWKELGALEYRETVGDDLSPKGVKPFGKTLRLKGGETVLFSWIVYRSRAHRDRVNAKVMKDPRIANMMSEKDMPFDVKRMMYGGFKVAVDIT
jgi:uncharacterized protein YbaA (DUF1428 family)